MKISGFMETQFTATLQKDGDWWLGWIEEIKGVNAQETTQEELIKSLHEALSDILALNQEEVHDAPLRHYSSSP